MEGRLTHSSTPGIIQMAKKACSIPGENKDLTDAEVAEVCKFLASRAPDTTTVNGKLVFGEIGVSLMLSIALYEFPEFYQRHELWQRN